MDILTLMLLEMKKAAVIECLNPLLVLSKTGKCILLILIMALFTSVACASGGDTTKTKYDINDPRNPDCPCHKYQQLADKEYEELIANQDFQVAVKNITEDFNESLEFAQKEVLLVANEIAVNNRRELNKEKTGSLKMAADAKTESTKVNKHVFKKHRALKRNSAKPKKRKIRFGKKDGSRCSHW